jgi:hypothetical protein
MTDEALSVAEQAARIAEEWANFAPDDHRKYYQINQRQIAVAQEIAAAIRERLK